MFRGTAAVLARSFRVNLKYPSLVSYNKLPWEVVNHDSTKLHMHLAPNIEQLLTLAAAAHVPNLNAAAHPNLPETERLRVLPGFVYVLGGAAAQESPPGFTTYRVADPTCMQYYGRIHNQLALLQRVDMCTSADLRLLCLALHFEGTLAGTSAGSSLELATGGSPDGAFAVFYYFRPNRPATELTRPFEKFYQHRPSLAALDGLGTAATWRPVLQVPRRSADKTRLTPAAPYQPPQNYLMGLAERLAVRPGDSFGRRSQMWGTWF